MKDIKKSIPIKILSFFLCSVSLLLFTASAVCTGVMLYVDFYTGDKDVIVKEALETVAFEYAWRIGNFASDTIEIKDGKVSVNEEMRNSNNAFLAKEFPEVYYSVKLSDKTVLVSNYNGEDVDFTVNCSDRVPIYKVRTGDDNGIRYDTAQTTESESFGGIDVSTYEPEEYEDTDAPVEYVYVDIYTEVFVPHSFESPFGRLAFTKLCAEKAFELRFVCPAVCAVSFFVFIFLFIFFMWSAGSNKGKSAEDISVIHRLPFDVVTAFLVLLASLEVIFIGECLSHFKEWLILITMTFIIFCDILIVLFYLYSFAVRCNTRTLFRNTLVYVTLRFIIRCVKNVVRFFVSLVSALPLIRKTVLAACVVCISELFALFLWAIWEADPGWLCFWWFVGKALLIPCVFYFAVQLKKLKQGGKEILSGELTYRIDTKGMLPELREHGETLNGIGDRVALAVEEKLKSERLKTELITNVSHDIKTPLTSIINYVDLLKKEEFENERIGEYVEVLDRQSARLKKLVNDLVEASKAATGNVSVELSRLDAGLLVSQVLGEYEERLNAAGLTTVFTKPNESLYVLGDGSLMWRVFDNLMSNICKYAQSGTRVYVSVEKSDGHAVITLKNISAYPLNISEDELIERFVRGDSSRSTEGSGLGLSIANSLCTLQNAKLTISVDGDLFKAKVEVLGENI